MFTWNMWSTVEGIAEAILREILSQIREAKSDRYLDIVMEEFKDYRKQVKDRYFNVMWFVGYGLGVVDVPVEDLRKRAKRYVYRFFVQKEQDDPQYFNLYPACFR